MYGTIKNMFGVMMDTDVGLYSRARQIIRQVCDKESNCIDIGAGRGRALNILLDAAPHGEHYVFEPNPQYRELLVQRYMHDNCHIADTVVNNQAGVIRKSYTIALTINQPVEGRRKRKRDTVVDLELPTAPLDEIVPESYLPAMIKIDAKENDVYEVLLGAQQVIGRARPHILFVHGMGDRVDANRAREIYRLLAPHKLRISTPDRWLGNKPCFTGDEFVKSCTGSGVNGYLAYP